MNHWSGVLVARSSGRQMDRWLVDRGLVISWIGARWPWPMAGRCGAVVLCPRRLVASSPRRLVASSVRGLGTRWPWVYEGLGPFR